MDTLRITARGNALTGADLQNQTPTAPPAATGARAELDDAVRRIKEFIFGDDYDACGNVDSWRHNFDRCSAPPVETPKLFVAGPCIDEHGKNVTDADAVDQNDISQDSIGDCGLMASLAALARTDKGRALIHDAVVENKGPGGEVQSYTVTLYEHSHFRLGGPTFHPTKTTVDLSFTRGHAIARSCDGNREVWPLVIEKAVAQLLGGYKEVIGIEPDVALETLTGKEARRLDVADGTYAAADLERDVTAGRVVVLATGHSTLPYNLVSNHAYAVTGIEHRDDGDYVLLHNPWNRSDQEPPAIPIGKLHELFLTASTISP